MAHAMQSARAQPSIRQGTTTVGTGAIPGRRMARPARDSPDGHGNGARPEPSSTRTPDEFVCALGSVFSEGETIVADKPAPKAVSIHDAAHLVGVSYWTIRRRVSDGTIKAFRVGRSLRIPVAELDKLMRRSIPTVGGAA